ncbi:MAG: methyltransferase domain-containing protein [Anaerolineales bacterium]|nr:methyltransferase domain-containing protein [Anaerolineales bacterium]
MSVEVVAQQLALIETLKASGALTQPAVAAAFRAVPRHRFLPEVPLAEVYSDEAIPTKFSAGHAISSSSQPAIMAIMLEQLAVAPGQRILEIGAGTGFNAALLAYLVGPHGRVLSVDLDADIVAGARANLAAAGIANVEVICADGGHGYAPASPYDRVILTVSAWDIAPAWYEQLVPGGRLVLPLEFGLGPQASVALDKPARASPDRLRLVSRSVRCCGFMRLRGAFAGPHVELSLGLEPGLTLSLAGDPPVSTETILTWLEGGRQLVESSLAVSTRDAWGGLGWWLGLRAPDQCALTAGETWAGRGIVPCLLPIAGRRPACLTIGLAGAGGLALLSRQPGLPADEAAPFAVRVEVCGPNPMPLAEALLAHLAGWQAAGRPGTHGLRLRVYAPDGPVSPLEPGAIRVQKRWTCQVVDWPGPPA